MSGLQWLEHYCCGGHDDGRVVVFLIVVTTYWPGRKAGIEQQGRIPLEDDV